MPLSHNVVERTRRFWSWCRDACDLTKRRTLRSRMPQSYRPEIDAYLEERIVMAGNLTVLPSLLVPGPGSPVSVGNTPDSILATHLDNTSTPYLLVANYYGNTISVLQGSNTGAFQNIGTYNVGSGPNGFAVGDFSNDG